ncbi:MAG: site-specific integrase [Clostridia bacterium]|nr:site-specific integrase [Clostridia bacterium]
MASVKPNYNKAKEIISYRFRACIGRDAQGKQKMISKTVDAPIGLSPAKAMKRMQAEAEEWGRKASAGLIPTQKKTFKRFIEDSFFPIHVLGGNHSPSTVGFYRDICDRLTRQFGSIALTDIKAIDINKYLTGLRAQYSAAYTQHFKTVLTVLFGFAENNDLIERNPMRKVYPIKRDRQEVDFLSVDEARKFLSCLDESADLFWRTAMYIFVFLGIRRGELAGLQWQDVDFTNRTIRIKRNVINNRETGHQNMIKETKTANSDRVLPLQPVLVDLLKAWKAEQAKQYQCFVMPSAFIFNKLNDLYSPIRPDSITQWLSRFNARHGLRNVSPHDLRHTVGSLMLSAGATVKEVQKFLGHADASTTLKFYAGTDLNGLKTASDKLATALAD